MRKSRTETRSGDVSVSGDDLMHALQKALTVQFALVDMMGDVLEAVSTAKRKSPRGPVFILENSD